MAYNRKDSGGGSREAFGNFAITSQYPHKVYNPRSEKKGNVTEIKIIPAVDPEDGSFAPQVVPVDGMPIEGIGDTFHAAEFVSFLGEKKYQFVTDTSDFPDKQSPTRMFYNKLNQFLKDEGEKNYPKWAEWAKWGGGAKLPSCVMMLQSALVRLNGEHMTDKQGNRIQVAPIVMVFNRSATIDFENKLTEIVDASKPISADNSKIGDVTSPGGHTLLIDAFTNEEGRKRYEVSAGEKMSMDEQFIKATFVPWDKLMRVEPAAWQIARLVETFDAASVDMVFSSDPEYAQFIPEIAKGAFRGKGSVPVGPPVIPPPAPIQQPAQQAPVQQQVTTGTPVQQTTTSETPQVMNIQTTADADALMDEVKQATGTTTPASGELADNPIMQSLMKEKEAALNSAK